MRAGLARFTKICCISMRKLGGSLLIITSIICILVLYSDDRESRLFEQQGKKIQATITAIQFSLPGRIALSQGKTEPHPDAFNYAYMVSGKEYENHIPYDFHVGLHKGDSIEIEYLENDPSISRYTGAIKDTAVIAIFIKLFCMLIVTGLALIIWPLKKEKIV